jgi:hypothetical protein
MQNPFSSTPDSDASALSRRSFLSRATAASAAASLGGGLLLLGSAEEASALPPPGARLDAAVLNFALNLEYLEAEFYVYAVTGQGIEARGVQVSGKGTPGTVTIKQNPLVPFTTTAFREYAKEIAADEVAHVNLLRAALADLPGGPVARPAINLLQSFNTLAQAAGIVPAGGTFDPFESELNFLLGAFIFEDVGVTAYKGAAKFIQKRRLLEAAAGILAVEAYHAGIIRTVLLSLGRQEGQQSILDTVKKISDLRDVLDGADDRDQELTTEDGEANLVPTDENGLAYSRSTRQVLNIVYGAADATGGLFFPGGMNGRIKA